MKLFEDWISQVTLKFSMTTINMLTLLYEY